MDKLMNKVSPEIFNVEHPNIIGSASSLTPYLLLGVEVDKAMRRVAMVRHPEAMASARHLDRRSLLDDNFLSSDNWYLGARLTSLERQFDNFNSDEQKSFKKHEPTFLVVREISKYAYTRASAFGHTAFNSYGNDYDRALNVLQVEMADQLIASESELRKLNQRLADWKAAIGVSFDSDEYVMAGFQSVLDTLSGGINEAELHRNRTSQIALVFGIGVENTRRILLEDTPVTTKLK